MGTRNWITIDDVRLAARRKLPRMVFDFIDGGAEAEVTLRRNREAFERIGFSPRVLVDVSEVRLATTVLGTALDVPVVCGPTGMPGLTHRGAEIAAARAAAAVGTAFTVSTTSSYPIDEIRRRSDAPLWFQLYAWKDRGMTTEILQRAKEAGVRTLLFTVDTPIAGTRERDLRNGMSIPPRPTPANAIDVALHPQWALTMLRGPGARLGTIAALGAAPRTGALGIAGWFGHLFNPKQSWADLEWIRDQWDGPVAVKGVMTATDARRAADLGAAGVVVSNHGGRQLDGLPATIEALPLIAEELSGTGVDVLLDGGVRRGSDVVKALALGARAVLIGRPWLFGLAGGNGERGARRVLELLASQTRDVMTLLGVADVADLGREHLVDLR